MTEAKTITREQYAAFGKLYNEGKFPGQRYGQAFLNHFREIKDPDPIIFYNPDRQKTKAMILGKYVQG